MPILRVWSQKGCRPMMTFLLVLFALYWVPTFVAIARQSRSALGIAALSLLLTAIAGFIRRSVAT